MRYRETLTAAADALAHFLPVEETSQNHVRMLRALSDINLNPELPRLTATYIALSAPVASTDTGIDKNGENRAQSTAPTTDQLEEQKNDDATPEA